MIRAYQDSDYGQLYELYQHSEWFGGEFDEARDSREKLANKIVDDSEAIWVCDENNEIVGSISIIEDGRVAWLYRFVAKDNNPKIAQELYEHAIPIFKSRGHTQIIAYSPVDDETLAKRYSDLGMAKGNSYTAYWTDI